MLLGEPFIGYAQTKEENEGAIKFFICRNTAPFGFTPHKGGIEYASYLSPAGRLIAKNPGEIHSFSVKGRVEQPLASYGYEIVIKNQCRVDSSDITQNKIEWVGGKTLIRSLRELDLTTPEEEPARDVQYSVQLPDQPILDQIQDEIFRMPLNSRVRISGAPGTGKTTVLLKRISQKTKWEFLTDKEKQGLSENEFINANNWVMFTPSDLLKGYLKEAMAKELLPASDENVKVFKTFKLSLLTEIGFLQVGGQGVFKRTENNSLFLKSNSGYSQQSLNDDFKAHLELAFSQYFESFTQRFINKINTQIESLETEITTKIEPLIESILHERLDEKIKELAEAEIIPLEDVSDTDRKNLKNAAESSAANFKGLIREIRSCIELMRHVENTLDEKGLRTPDSILKAADRWKMTADRIDAEDCEAAVFPEIKAIIKELKRTLRALITDGSWPQLFEQIPKAFQSFRTSEKCMAEHYTEEAVPLLKEKYISDAEENILLNQALTFMGQTHCYSSGNLTVQAILSKRRLMVTVDEVTDFSPIELACMEKLCSPQGGITICGVLMQRMSEVGIKSWAEIDEAGGSYKSFELSRSYRQSNRLFEIALDLFRDASGSIPPYKSAYPKRDQDPPALSHKPNSKIPTELWLEERICEIFHLCGRKLPTTAVLVTTKKDVGKLEERLRPLLSKNSIELDASHNSQNIGDSARVRIFPVQEIKGLEFEAVFYIDLDRMAEVHESLIDKYVYVGLSRARNFLGVTFDNRFPKKLSCIEKHFQLNGKWSS